MIKQMPSFDSMEENRATSDTKTSTQDRDDIDGSSEFEAVSCFVISKDNKARRWMIQLIKWPYPFRNISQLHFRSRILCLILGIRGRDARTFLQIYISLKAQSNITAE